MQRHVPPPLCPFLWLPAASESCPPNVRGKSERPFRSCAYISKTERCLRSVFLFAANCRKTNLLLRLKNSNSAFLSQSLRQFVAHRILNVRKKARYLGKLPLLRQIQHKIVGVLLGKLYQNVYGRRLLFVHKVKQYFRNPLLLRRKLLRVFRNDKLRIEVVDKNADVVSSGCDKYVRILVRLLYQRLKRPARTLFCRDLPGLCVCNKF